MRLQIICATALALLGLFHHGSETESLPKAPQVTISRAYLASQNLPAHGVAIDGYSPVSYFEGKAERGNPLFAVLYKDVTYHLRDAEEVRQFQASPEKYIPAFGGWCAFGMAVSDKFPVDPENFAIIRGRLMLFLRNASIDAKKLWLDGNEADLYAKASAHWKKVQG